jgi:hypothetical protein
VGAWIAVSDAAFTSCKAAMAGRFWSLFLLLEVASGRFLTLLF